MSRPQEPRGTPVQKRRCPDRNYGYNMEGVSMAALAELLKPPGEETEQESEVYVYSKSTQYICDSLLHPLLPPASWICVLLPTLIRVA